ncbi:MAG: matrixin family metalloprotease [Pseudonocardiaceae bacterium]
MSEIHVRSVHSPTEVGLKTGAQGPGVEDLQQYLRRFGYLSTSDDSITDTFDDATAEALRAYQGFHGLPPTAELDDSSVAQMAIPRCGFPDLWKVDDLTFTISRFVAQGNRWNRNDLRYGFQNFTPDVPQADIRGAVTAALALWSGVTPLTFAEVPINQNPEIRIVFAAGDHGDGNNFDGVGGTLAHAFFPPPNGGEIAGDAHFDEAETWSVRIPIPANRFDLQMLATHEFGHSLGLDHSTVAGAIMRPFFQAGTSQRFLHQDDIDGIRSIYGTPATVPSVEERRPPSAAAAVRAAGLVPKFNGTQGPNSFVFRQSPRGGTRVAIGSTVSLQLRNGPIP